MLCVGVILILKPPLPALALTKPVEKLAKGSFSALVKYLYQSNINCSINFHDFHTLSSSHNSYSRCCFIFGLDVSIKCWSLYAYIIVAAVYYNQRFSNHSCHTHRLRFVCSCAAVSEESVIVNSITLLVRTLGCCFCCDQI